VSSEESYLKTKKLVMLSLFLGVGVVLYVAELFYFPPLPIPGAKLGLANIVTLILMGFYRWQDALFNTIVRTIAGAIVTGTFLTPPFFFSLTGALTSFLVMYFVYRKFYGKFSFVGVSLSGSLVHNLSQLLLAILFIGHWGILFQTPFLILIAVPTGAFNGVVANYIIKRLGFLSWQPLET